MSLTVCHVTFINVMIWVSQKRRHKRLLIILYSIIFIVTKFFTIPNWPIQVRELILDSDGVWTKCQPDEMPTEQNANLGWHFVRDFFSVVGILSGSTFWLAFCPDHLNMFWHPPPQDQRVGGGPVTSFCLLLTVVGEK